MSALVFFFVSTRSSHHIHHQVIFILHLDHHSIWIISRSRTSLLDHHYGCYLLILLIIGSSTEPSLFHSGCISTEPGLFHTGCGSLQSQSFFILDVGHYIAGHFLCWIIDVMVTSECIHLYILCIAPQYLFREVFVI